MRVSIVISGLSIIGLAAAESRYGFMQHHSGMQKRVTCAEVPASTPDDQLCSLSCGPTYTQCINYDTCFDPSAGQVCCPDGNYCDAGEYCAVDSSGAGICCITGQPCRLAVSSLSTIPGGLSTSSTKTSPASDASSTTLVSSSTALPATPSTTFSGGGVANATVSSGTSATQSYPPIMQQTTNAAFRTGGELAQQAFIGLAGALFWI